MMNESTDTPENVPAPRTRVEITGILAGLGSVLLLLALVTFRLDPAEGAVAANVIGPVGAYIADTLFFTFGLVSFFAVAVGLAGTVMIFRGRALFNTTGEVFGYALGVLFLGAAVQLLAPAAVPFGHEASGLVGRVTGEVLSGLFGTIGALLISGAMLVVAAILVLDKSVLEIIGDAWRGLMDLRPTRSPREALELDDEDGEAWAMDDELDADDAFEDDDEDDEWLEPRPSLFARLFGRRRARRDDDLDALEDDDTWLLGDDEDEDDVDLDEATPEVAGQTTDDGWDTVLDEPVIHRPATRVEAAPAKAEATEQAPEDPAEDDATAVNEPSDVVAKTVAKVVNETKPAKSKPSIAYRAKRLVFGSRKAERVEPITEEIEIPEATDDELASGWDAEEVDLSAITGELEAVDDAPSARVTAELRSASALVETDAPLSYTAITASDDEDVDDDEDDLDVATAPVAAQAAVCAFGADDEALRFGPRIIEPEALRNKKRPEDLDRAEQRRLKIGSKNLPWEYPPLSFLGYQPSENAIDADELKAQAMKLTKVLSEFKVKGTVSDIIPGPVITMFEFVPAPGTKVNKIEGLSKELAMALEARSVRVIAPIPGKGCVGIEVPNVSRETVYLKEIMADDKFTKHKSKLVVALGKNTEGEPVVDDLGKMPHLLVAGTTGSGKSVGVNGMITSLLYNASPEDVRMIMIDPKQLEFALYEDIPHLLLPVVTDPAKAATALDWAVAEMERRYQRMSQMKVRNLKGYNKKLKILQKQHAEAPDTLDTKTFDMLAELEPDGKLQHRHMPYIVVIIDEFADLMMVAGKDVEIAVARLAQKARAAGIHVILATQRPSVDVLTGMIKANFPTRMSFRLISGTDSRTVLSTNGAENLLGMGDMLYRPPGSSDLMRVHGAYVDEAEIEQIAEFLKSQAPPQYDESILQFGKEEEEYDDDEPADEKYDLAVQVVVEAGYASISMVQRKLRIGYNRAARIIEMMEREGLVGKASGGSSRREVLVGDIPAPI